MVGIQYVAVGCVTYSSNSFVKAIENPSEAVL